MDRILLMLICTPLTLSFAIYNKSFKARPKNAQSSSPLSAPRGINNYCPERGSESGVSTFGNIKYASTNLM